MRSPLIMGALVFCLVIVVISAVTNIFDELDGAHFTRYTGFIIGVVVWAVVLLDVVKNEVYNKAFWLVSMFNMPYVAVLYFIMQREGLIRLAQKF